MLDNYPKNEFVNHYSSLRPKNNKNSINNDRLNEIKNNIINNYLIITYLKVVLF